MRAPNAPPAAVGDPVDLAGWLASGRVVELSGASAANGVASARTTSAVSLVAHAQRQGEPVVWVEGHAPALYPPDLADAGVDLERLVVVRPGGGRAPSPVRAGTSTPRPDDGFRAAELLLRSGAFGLIVVDLVGTAEGGARAIAPGRAADVWLGRLAGLARRHRTQVVLLTGSPAQAGSLGALVSTRVAPERVTVGPGLHRVEATVLKDKVGHLDTRGTPQGTWRRAPWGAVGPRAGTPASPDPAGAPAPLWAPADRPGSAEGTTASG